MDDFEIELVNNSPSFDLDVTPSSLEIETEVSKDRVVISVEKDYNKLNNQPQINSVTLIGNKSSEDLNLQEKITEENKLDYSLIDNTPNKLSDFENDGDGESLFATEDYVEEHGGKIDGADVNDVAQQIVNKRIKINIDKTTVGLSNVDNTSDMNKPVSTAQSTAINDVQNNLNTHINNKNNPHEVTKSQVGLSNVDNTSDANKPISTATQSALDTITTNIESLDNSKVDKVSGKQLSTNDFTDTYKANVEANNLKVSNVQSDWNSSSGLSVILNKPGVITNSTIDTLWGGNS